MDPGRWQQIEQIFHSAREKETGERAAFLDTACAADPSLRSEIESLLALADDADGYLKAAVREAGSQTGVAATAIAAGRDLPPANRKLGRYEILEQLGRGGMGVVYRAVDPAIGRTVAIKTILLEGEIGENNAELRARLLRESQAGGQLSHPNIVAVYDVSEQGGAAYIVMEYVVGRTLEQSIGGQAPFRSIREALRIVGECADALDYAHRRGIVHRDIKPANIMLQLDGSVKIADFGIAKAARFAPLTRTDCIVGSPHCMAPEQWRGEAATGRTDQYALAAVAYTLLTGRRPFERDSAAALAAACLNEEPPAATKLNPALPPALDDVFRKALAKVPTARYETCGQFAGALRAACEQTALAPVVAGPRPASARWHWLVAVAAFGALAVAAGGAWLYQRSSTTQVEIAYWTSIKDSKSSVPFEDYLKRYPGGHFAGLAQAQLEALRNQGPERPAQPAAETKASARASHAKSSEPSRSGLSERDHAPPGGKSEPPSAGDPYVQGEALLKSGAYAEAVPYLSRAIAIKPDYRSYLGRAGAYQHLDQWEQAIQDYTEAIRYSPSSALPYHERGVCLTRLNQDERALADFNRAIELAPNLALSWNGRGVIYLHRREYETAVAAFTEAIRLNPNLEQAFHNRATAKKALGDTAGATDDLNRALTLKR